MKNHENDMEKNEALEAAEEAVKAIKVPDLTPEKRERRFNTKTLKHGTLATILTAVFLAVLVLLNVVATIVFDKFPITFDLTNTNTYSVSQETLDYVEKIDVDVQITVLAEQDTFEAYNDYTLQASRMLHDYATHNSRISIRYVDFLSNPDVLKDYSDDLAQYDIIVETSAKGSDGKEYKKTRVLEPVDLVNFSAELDTMLQNYGMTFDTMIAQYGADFAMQQFASYIESSNAEQAITSALIAVTDPNPVTITMLTGRNESSDLSYFQTLLEANGYIVNSVNITSQDIPADAKCIVMAAPQEDYLPEEITKVSNFLTNDGKLEKNLIYLASDSQKDTPNIDEFLAEYGLKIEPTFVKESNENYTVGGYPNLITEFVTSDNFTQDLKKAKASNLLLFYNARPITQLFKESGMQITEAYVQSSSGAYATATAAVDDTAATVKGVQNGLVVASKGAFAKDAAGNDIELYSNILAIGSVQFLNDAYLRYAQYQNSDYILSLMNGFNDKTKTSITIKPKTITGNLFDLTNHQANTLKWLFTLAIPVIILIVGLVIWLKRKNK
ncbi:MAG: Gldg family protein [Oscillospiraceae bacterium]